MIQLIDRRLEEGLMHQRKKHSDDDINVEYVFTSESRVPNTLLCLFATICLFVLGIIQYIAIEKYIDASTYEYNYYD